MHYIGLMSGTSADGIDAALVSISPAVKLSLLATHAHPFPPAVQSEIQLLMHPGANELERVGELDAILGELFAEAANSLLAKTGIEKSAVRAIGSHGQTLRHSPRAKHPFTIQIGNPSVIAQRSGMTTVADFRGHDIAAGGQGAPLVPAFHRWMFHSPKQARTIINIGGIANLSYLPADASQPVLGFDTGPGNTLLDRWIHRHQAKSYDKNGSWAASGKVSEALLERLLADFYFKAAPPKSTGQDRFNLDWLESHLKTLRQQPSTEDVQATLLQLTVRSIADAIRQFLPSSDAVYVCGGGAHNLALMSALTSHLGGIPVSTTETLGLSPDWVEAAAFAWLAHQTLEGLPGNLPSVTGARRAVILGGIYKA